MNHSFRLRMSKLIGLFAGNKIEITQKSELASCSFSTQKQFQNWKKELYLSFATWYGVFCQSNCRTLIYPSQSAPLPILESHELAAMTLEYRRECRKDSVVQSLTSVLGNGVGDMAISGYVECQHLLRLEGGAEIVKGRTVWRPKYANRIGSMGQLPAASA